MDVENLLSKDLLDSLASLEAPKHQRQAHGFRGSCKDCKTINVTYDSVKAS